MKCPVCGHKVRPSKKYPGKYLCDTCRKRFPASAVIPDDTDTRSARSSAHKHESVSVKKRPAARQQAFFDDPLNGPEIYHSTAAAMRSMRKNVPEAEEAEAQKKTIEKKRLKKFLQTNPFPEMNPPYRSMLQFQNQLSAPVRQMNLLPNQRQFPKTILQAQSPMHLLMM